MYHNAIKWINILHFYQPPFQKSSIIERVVEECYLPVTKSLVEKPNAKAVININGALLDSLVNLGFEEVIVNLGQLLSNGQIEIIGTGKYHPIFPLITVDEVKRQIELQEQSLNRHLLIDGKPHGLFLPELAYLPEQLSLFKEKGYQWAVVDETSVMGSNESTIVPIVREEKWDFILLVRDRHLSEAFGNSIWRDRDIITAEDFYTLACEGLTDMNLVVTATDVEVFGHHQKDRWRLLSEIYDYPKISSITTAHVTGDTFIKRATMPSSWSTTKEDIEQGIFYPLWSHPKNPIHQILWRLLHLVLEEVKASGDEELRVEMDQFLCSCPFFWCSLRPWWYGEIAEDFSEQLLETLENVDGISLKTLNRAQNLRYRIYKEIKELNDSGKAKKLQDSFLQKKGLKRELLESTLL
jgi:hypothetical protein